MAKSSWDPTGTVKGEETFFTGSVDYYVYMREDGSFATEFKDETGFQMRAAAVDVLHMIAARGGSRSMTMGGQQVKILGRQVISD